MARPGPPPATAEMQRCPLGSIAVSGLVVQGLDDRTEMREGHRSFTCRGCKREIQICSRCDRGQVYCSRPECQSQRVAARRASKLQASLNYQQTKIGKLNHSARQARWRNPPDANVTRQAPPRAEPEVKLETREGDAAERLAPCPGGWCDGSSEGGVGAEPEAGGEDGEVVEADGATGLVAGSAAGSGGRAGAAGNAGTVAGEPASAGRVRCDFCGRWCRGPLRRGFLRRRGRGFEAAFESDS